MRIKINIMEENVQASDGCSLTIHAGLKRGWDRCVFKPNFHSLPSRLEKAKLLLERERISVSEAALLVGYSNFSHFASIFRKTYGINPSCTANGSRNDKPARKALCCMLQGVFFVQTRREKILSSIRATSRGCEQREKARLVSFAIWGRKARSPVF
ncbi:helix-turn-helix domain-containing protein [Brevibacillus agri]